MIGEEESIRRKEMKVGGMLLWVNHWLMRWAGRGWLRLTGADSAQVSCKIGRTKPDDTGASARWREGGSSWCFNELLLLSMMMTLWEKEVCLLWGQTIGFVLSSISSGMCWDVGGCLSFICKLELIFSQKT